MSKAIQRISQLVRHQSFSTSAPTMSDAIESALAQYSTCEVSDALVKLKVPSGGYLPGIDRLSPVGPTTEGGETVCGKAYTVQMVAGTNTSAPKPSVHFADAAPQGSVIVISTPSNARSASWGGLMTLRAQALGAKGVVLDGRCRDLGEHRDAGFNVFARGHSTLGQSPFTRPSELNKPLTIVDPTQSTGDAQTDPSFPPTTVNPGDYILADIDGVVVVAPSLVDQVLELAAKGREVDGRVAADLKQGVSVAEAFKRHRGK